MNHREVDDLAHRTLDVLHGVYGDNPHWQTVMVALARVVGSMLAVVASDSEETGVHAAAWFAITARAYDRSDAATLLRTAAAYLEYEESGGARH